MRARSASRAAGSGVVVVISDVLSGRTGPVCRRCTWRPGSGDDRWTSGAVGLVGCGSQLELDPALSRDEVEVGGVALDVAADERAERQHRRPRLAGGVQRAPGEHGAQPPALEGRVDHGVGERHGTVGTLVLGEPGYLAVHQHLEAAGLGVVDDLRVLFGHGVFLPLVIGRVGQAATVACISHTRTSAASVAVIRWPPVAVNRTASPVRSSPAPSRVTVPRGTNRCRKGASGSSMVWPGCSRAAYRATYWLWMLIAAAPRCLVMPEATGTSPPVSRASSISSCS